MCDTFDPIAVCKAIREVMKAVDPKDEIVINYAGGSACVRLMLGLTGILFSEFLPMRVVYSVRYQDGVEVYQDQTGQLRNIFKQTREFFGLDSFKKILEAKVIESLTFYQDYGVAKSEKRQGKLS